MQTIFNMKNNNSKIKPNSLTKQYLFYFQINAQMKLPTKCKSVKNTKLCHQNSIMKLLLKILDSVMVIIEGFICGWNLINFRFESLKC